MVVAMESTNLEIILDDIDVNKVLQTYKINKDTVDEKMYTSISDLGKSAQSISFFNRRIKRLRYRIRWLDKYDLNVNWNRFTEDTKGGF